MKTYKEFIAEAKDEPWVLVQNRKEIKRFKRKQDAKMTSSRGQELMSVAHAKKMGIQMNEVSKDHPDRQYPQGKMFKDKLGQLHIIAGGSRSLPMAVTFDPKWGQLSSYGSFGNDMDNWIPWTKMVKKATVKKFIAAVKYELDLAKNWEGVLRGDEHAGIAALKHLKRMGR